MLGDAGGMERQNQRLQESALTCQSAQVAFSQSSHLASGGLWGALGWGGVVSARGCCLDSWPGERGSGLASTSARAPGPGGLPATVSPLSAHPSAQSPVPGTLSDPQLLPPPAGPCPPSLTTPA